MNLAQIKAQGEALFESANRRSGGILEILRQSFVGFSRVQAPEGAAAIAYYTIFSIFPLLLVLISAAGFFLKGQESITLVMNLINQILPASIEGLEGLLRQIVAARNVTGIIGLIGLIWAASSVFKTLANNINDAWPDAKKETLLRDQVFAVAMIALLVALMIAWTIWSSIVGVLNARGFPILGQYISVHENILNPVSKLILWIAAFALFLMIYRFLPNIKVLWSEAFWGALLALIACGVLTLGFGWYLRSGLAHYDLVYGSLGTAIALLTWIYINAMIILFGAHLSASIARTKRLGNPSVVETKGRH